MPPDLPADTYVAKVHRGERREFERIVEEPHVQPLPRTPRALWETIVDLYWFDLLSEASRERLEREGLPLLHAAARTGDGLVHATQLFSLLTCVRR